MKIIYYISILLSFIVGSSFAQCDSYGSISVATSGYESGSGYIQEYVLVNSSTDVIVEINSTGSFSSISSGDYYVYAVNYEGSRPTELIAGNLWADITAYDADVSNCFEALSPYSGGTITVCNQACVNNPLSVSSSGYYTGGSTTQTYVLIESPASSNSIIASNLLGEFTDEDYSSEGLYEIYAVNTEENEVKTTIEAGSSWTAAMSTINANCADYIGPIYYEMSTSVCPNPLSNANLVLDGDNVSGYNNLEWSFEDDVEVDHFNIYKTDGNTSYKKIAQTINPYFVDYDVESLNYYKVELIAKSNNEGIYSNSVLLERENGLGEGISIFPNPVRDNLGVILNTSGADFNVSVLNSIGEIVITGEYKSDLDENRVDINVESLAGGLYFIHILIGEEQLTKRFIKTN